MGSPRLERVFERSMMMCLLGLLRTERLAREISAVTRVMEILGDGARGARGQGGLECPAYSPGSRTASYPSIQEFQDCHSSHPAHPQQQRTMVGVESQLPGSYLPSNRCFKKSNKAFCIMSVT